MATALRGPLHTHVQKEREESGAPRNPEGSCKAVRVLLEGWTGQRSLEPGDISAKGPGRRGSRKGAWGHAGALRPPGGGGAPELELVLAADGQAPGPSCRLGSWLVGAPPPRRCEESSSVEGTTGLRCRVWGLCRGGGKGTPFSIQPVSPQTPSGHLDGRG